MPSLSASAHSDTTNDSNTALGGELYSVNGGWQGEQYFANLNVLHGDYQVGSVVENPVVNSALSGALNMSSNHAQLNAGARFDFAGARLSPSVSLFAGDQKQDACTASGGGLGSVRAAVSTQSESGKDWVIRVEPLLVFIGHFRE